VITGLVAGSVVTVAPARGVELAALDITPAIPLNTGVGVGVGISVGVAVTPGVGVGLGDGDVPPLQPARIKHKSKKILNNRIRFIRITSFVIFKNTQVRRSRMNKLSIKYFMKFPIKVI
jgi:hypothetical protein